MTATRGFKDFVKDTDIYDMCLFDRLSLPQEGLLTRVPGGWIYHSQFNPPRSAVFIPYHEGFNKDPEEILNLARNENETPHKDSNDPDPLPGTTDKAP